MNGENKRCFLYEENLAQEWDDFVLEHPLGSIHQITSWKIFQESVQGRGPVFGFGVRDNKGKICGVTWCVGMDTGFFGKKWFYSARGPVIDITKYEKEGKMLVDFVIQYLKKQKALFWRMDPYFDKPIQMEQLLGNHNFFLPLKDYQPQHTLFLDITQSEEDLLSQMKRKGRYNINLARKKEVTIEMIPSEKCKDEDIDDFYRLNTQTTQRDGFFGHKKDYYVSFLKHLNPWGVLFFARWKSERIASAISTFCGEKSIYYFGASSSDPAHRSLMAPYLLQWEMIRYAKAQGHKTYDFLGIAPEGDLSHAYSGITEFKLKFGGDRKSFIPGAEIMLDALWYRIYRGVKML